ncbi:MAG: permease [Proteobacteria bacterium]|nr:permease [Pseudomonadota bacterium]
MSHQTVTSPRPRSGKIGSQMEAVSDANYPRNDTEDLEMLDVITGIAVEAFVLLARMAPYLLLGIVVAGAMHVLLPVGFVASQLGKAGIGSVFKAAALGVPLPLCSCGVVPVAASLKKSGASPGSVVSFLVTTPTSGVDSILATYSLLGGAIAIARVIASFLIGLVAGIATSIGLKKQTKTEDVSQEGEPIPNATGSSPFVRAAAYGFGELLGGIARPLVIGSLLGGAISYFLPPGVLEQYIGQGLISYIVMLAVGIPLYVCASGSIPLAAALLAKGISPGAALVFLIAGPATNAATVTVISGMLGKRALTIYLSFLIVGSLVAGAAADAVFTGFPSLLPEIIQGAAHGENGLKAYETITGVGLGLLVMYHLMKPLVARFRNKKRDEDMFQLKVPDMNCQHCSGAIKNAISGLTGVKNVDANPTTKIVKIDMEEDVDRDAVAQAIIDAGFHPEVI